MTEKSMENNRRRRGEPVIVDGREGTIEFGDDTRMSIYCEKGGRVITNGTQNITRDPGGFRPVWDHLAQHDKKFTEVTDHRLVDALAKLQALCATENISIVGDFTVWIDNDVGYDQLEELSGEELTHWNRSRGQVKG